MKLGDILKALSPLSPCTRYIIVNRVPATGRYLCPECKRLLAEVQTAAGRCPHVADCPVLRPSDN